jgi:hypothetical protein
VRYWCTTSLRHYHNKLINWKENSKQDKTSSSSRAINRSHHRQTSINRWAEGKVKTSHWRVGSSQGGESTTLFKSKSIGENDWERGRRWTNMLGLLQWINEQVEWWLFCIGVVISATHWEDKIGKSKQEMAKTLVQSKSPIQN